MYIRFVIRKKTPPNSNRSVLLCLQLQGIIEIIIDIALDELRGGPSNIFQLTTFLGVIHSTIGYALLHLEFLFKRQKLEQKNS